MKVSCQFTLKDESYPLGYLDWVGYPIIFNTHSQLHHHHHHHHHQCLNHQVIGAPQRTSQPVVFPPNSPFWHDLRCWYEGNLKQPNNQATTHVLHCMDWSGIWQAPMLFSSLSLPALFSSPPPLMCLVKWLLSDLMNYKIWPHHCRLGVSVWMSEDGGLVNLPSGWWNGPSSFVTLSL